MKNWKQIANDYYLEGLNNASIFEKYNLDRTKPYYSQERVYECLPKYSTGSICPHCQEKMVAKFVSKSAGLFLDGSGLLCSEPNIHELVEQEKTQTHILECTPHFYGWAYMTPEGYRVSLPECPSCGHHQTTYCDCSNCSQIKIANSIRAAEIVYAELESRQKYAVDDLTCSDILAFLTHFNDGSSNSSSNLAGCCLKSDDVLDKSLALFLLGVFDIDRTHSPAGIKMTSINTYVPLLDKVCFEPKSPTAVSDCVRNLKDRARSMYLSDANKTELVEVWQNLAVDESLNILEYYCGIHGLYYRPGEKTTNVIKKSLRTYGLALTARYIYNSVWFSKKQANEAGFSELRAFNQVYGNLSFWVDDPRARAYTAHPFTRKDGVFSEPNVVSVFSEFFLEPHGINYLSSAIAVNKDENI